MTGYGQNVGRRRVDGEVGHEHLAEDHDRADGQVDTCGQNDECLRDGEGSDDHRLLDHQRDRGGEKEPLVDQAEDEHHNDQNDQGTQPGVAVQGHLQALNRAALDSELFLEVVIRGGLCAHRGASMSA